MGYNLGIKLSNMIFTREINLLCSKIITASKANHNECGGGDSLLAVDQKTVKSVKDG